MAEDVRISVASDADIVGARQQGRALAARLSFSPSECTLVATAISELARNIVGYARRGELTIRVVRNSSEILGIEIVARDEGPGISNISLALRDGYSTSGSLGLGLPGIKRLMDEFEIVSEVGQGTTVVIRKWQKQRRPVSNGL